ncbi:extracellular solute-binding protein [Georgenia satyanarayanai]|uniref:extracellular solute-binding protein n=1 Tax=Georgenia satyanarayanai TaxID=860221 RepID=UPI00204166CA|nr:extracellular solute-binding protein [Georgenia satyanarayanai]MCM3659943.1 extracellular solute-binding protein [Georgenia satyanarayanai]
MRRRIIKTTAVLTTALVLAACGGGTDTGTGTATDTGTDGATGGEDQTLTLWLMGGDTPDELREYLKDTFAEETGAELVIEEQDWADAVTKLTTALPDASTTPDVTEIGNTWASTFTGVGAFSDLSDVYEELGGDDLLPSFVAAGDLDGAHYALPYYFGSRLIWYRKDVWQEAGLEVPTTLAEFNSAVAELRTDDQSGFYIGGEDWRNGISWIFANGGEIAVQEGDEWVSALSSPATQEGLAQFQELFTQASNAPVTEADSTPWVNIIDNDTGAPEAATIIAPGWAYWSIGLPSEEDPDTLVWDDETFGVFALPGVEEGTVAPVFAGGSNIAISAASEKQDLARDLLRIIFSEEYQTMLATNGLGPANAEQLDAFVELNPTVNEPAAEAALGSKLTPAAPGWAAVEGATVLEEFFGKVAAGGDIAQLAAEYDEQLNSLLNN